MTLTNPMLPPSQPSSVPEMSGSFNDAIDLYISEINWHQIFQVTLVTMGCFFEIQQAFVPIFTDAVPNWSCSNSDCQNSTNVCQIPADSWSWNSPETISIISEWSLQCSNPIIRGLPSSSFFIGSLIGGLVVATVSDSKIGRKNTIVISCLVMSTAGILTAFSSNIWFYAAFRFVGGFGRAGVVPAGMVLATEMVGKRFRDRVGIIAYIWAPLGFISLPGIAYWYRNYSWRWIYLWISLPCFIYSFLVLIIGRESPRWLFMKRQKEEFIETLKSFATHRNLSSLTHCFLTRWEECANEDEYKVTHVFSTMNILLSKEWSFRRLMKVTLAGLGLGLVYYGIPLGLESLSFNLYLSVALNGVSEIPAAILTFICIRKFRRRILILNLTIISAICSLACGIARLNMIQISLELLLFVSVVTAFDVFLIYILELFPTCVRNSAMAIFRQAVVLGGAIGPQVVAVEKENLLISYSIFAVAISLYGWMVYLLPETKGRIWTDTMEEEEEQWYSTNAGSTTF